MRAGIWAPFEKVPPDHASRPRSCGSERLLLPSEDTFPFQFHYTSIFPGGYKARNLPVISFPPGQPLIDSSVRAPGYAGMRTYAV